MFHMPFIQGHFLSTCRLLRTRTVSQVQARTISCCHCLLSRSEITWLVNSSIPSSSSSVKTDLQHASVTSTPLHSQLRALNCELPAITGNKLHHFGFQLPAIMVMFRGPSQDPSSSSSETSKFMGEVSDEMDNSESESSGTEQSFSTAYAATPPVPRKRSRKARFIERFDSVKLTEANLTALQTGHKRITPKPASIIDNHFRFEPSPGAKTFRISRKPLPDSAREAVQKVKDETGAAQDQTLANPTQEHRPCFPRSNTNFTDILPYHQIGTWQQVDNEEWQRQRAHSISAVAVGQMKKLSTSCDGLSTQSKKTAGQLKGVIGKVVERGRLERRM